MTVSIPKLFQPIRVGTANLQHRVVMAPMSRFRADQQHVPGALAVEYYEQRTSVPGTLAIAESTIIAPRAGKYGRSPGIWNDEQVAGWKPVRLQSFFTSCIRDAWAPAPPKPDKRIVWTLPPLGRSSMLCTRTDRSFTSSSWPSDVQPIRRPCKRMADTRSSRRAQSHCRRKPMIRHRRRHRRQFPAP